MVIVLDDAAGPEQVRPFLPGASPSLVLITSRRRLTGLPHAQRRSDSPRSSMISTLCRRIT
jgi:hypothetical protein